MGVSPAGSLCPHGLQLRWAWVVYRDLSGSWDLQIVMFAKKLDCQDRWQTGRLAVKKLETRVGHFNHL